MLRVTAIIARTRIAVGDATTVMTALHATEPTTPHLALHIRVREVTVEDAADEGGSLMQSVVTNHGLIEGQQASRLVGDVVFVDLNAIDVTPISNDDVFELEMSPLAVSTWMRSRADSNHST